MTLMESKAPAAHAAPSPLEPAARRAVPVTLAPGDGIGPEIAAATLAVLRAAGAALAFEEIQIGEAVYRKGVTAGIEPAAWDSLRRTRVLLKGPVTTPQGGGYKSLNVTCRKALGLYANVRPCRAYAPFVASRHPGMDVVIVRENEEDTYAGIEHRQTAEVTQCLKLITAPGCEKIVRYAFAFAVANGRKKVTCVTKDNIMKVTDGLFHATFDRIAKEFSQVQADHMIVDIAAARLADTPGRFDVIVTPNLYGDILSDIAAQVAGSVGLAGSANIGDGCAMFEAVHGSAPDIAGKDVANPSGLIQAAVMMLVHVGQADVAEAVQNALLRTLEDGVHTADVYDAQVTRQKVGTRAFAQAVVDRLGLAPRVLKPARFHATPAVAPAATAPKPVKAQVGVDVFLDWDQHGRDPAVLGKRLETLAGPEFALKMVTNRGVKVYPDGLPETFCTDHWRCRFLGTGPVTHAHVTALLNRVAGAGLDFVKTEGLYTFDGVRGYSLGQGE